MVFRILFMYVYALFQVYILAFRNTVNARAVRSAFIVGGLAALPGAIFAEAVTSFHAANYAHLSVVLAAIEEIAKAAPVIYLFYRTALGRSASALDGVLLGAAVGAGFGFAEDAIYMIENAAVPDGYAAYAGVSQIAASWLPGGWSNGTGWFPGHLILGALIGAGVGFGRRLIPNRWLGLLPVGLMLCWTTLVHANFNHPPGAEEHSLATRLYGMTGSGAHLGLMVFVVIAILLVLNERVVRRSMAAAGAEPTRSIFQDIASVVESIGGGWRALRDRRRVLRGEEQVAQLRWELTRLSPTDPDAAAAELESASAALLTAQPEVGRPGVVSFFDPRGLSPLGVIYRLAGVVVLGYGFFLVFVTPSMNHAHVVDILRSTSIGLIALLGQLLIAWRFVQRRRAGDAEGRTHRTSAITVAACQSIVLWSALFTCIASWKQMYDVSVFPYPFRPAEALTVYNQFFQCLNASTAPKQPGVLAPIVTSGHAPGSRSEAP